MPALSKILLGPCTKLVDLNYDLLIFALESLKIKTKIIKASDYNFNGVKSDLVLDMCIQLKADIYIFGEQGRNYADIDKFNSKGITPYFQSYNHPIYIQRNKSFEPFMSFIDLLFNHGDNSLEILMSGNISREDVINK